MAPKKIVRTVTDDPNAQRQKIRDARLRVTLDQKRHRESPPAVKELAEMELPPLVVTKRVGRYSRKPSLGRTTIDYRM